MMPGTKRLETDRLILRRFQAEDAQEMYDNWASDPEVTKFLTWQPHENPEATRKLLESWIGRYEDGGYFNWVMELKETGKVIGNISVVELKEKTEAADIGYCMSRAYWGQGLMAEALRIVMEYLFDVADLNRVAACHDVNNPNSGRVMEKAGMQKEGILRAAGRNNQGIHDLVWYAAIAGDRKVRKWDLLVRRMGKLARTLDTINDIEEFEISEMLTERKQRNEDIGVLYGMSDEELLKAIKDYDWAHRWDPFFD